MDIVWFLLLVFGWVALVIVLGMLMGSAKKDNKKFDRMLEHRIPTPPAVPDKFNVFIEDKVDPDKLWADNIKVQMHSSDIKDQLRRSIELAQEELDAAVEREDYLAALRINDCIKRWENMLNQLEGDSKTDI